MTYQVPHKSFKFLVRIIRAATFLKHHHRGVNSVFFNFFWAHVELYCFPEILKEILACSKQNSFSTMCLFKTDSVNIFRMIYHNFLN